MSEPVGIIHPPPELRGIVDSTAKYVAKNGGAFEERIMREHKGKPKFSFLFPNDPFNAYYKHKVKEIRSLILSENEVKQASLNSQFVDSTALQSQGAPNEANNTNTNNNNNNNNNNLGAIKHRDDEQISTYQNEDKRHQRDHDDNQRQHEEAHGGDMQRDNQDYDEPQQDHEVRPRVRPKLNEYMQEISMKLEEPPHLNFLANPASFVTHTEMDIIKSTAQSIATHGRSFLLELVSREQNNPHFDFLKPQHGQFPYMTRLIMQYALIQNPPLDILEQLESDASNQKHVLDKIRMRTEWNKMLELEMRKRQEAEEKEKVLFSQIDWHDFVIVETIDYQYNEKGEYPPTRPDQVGTRLLQQQRIENDGAAENMDLDMDMDVESDQEEKEEEEDGQEDEFAKPDLPDASKLVIRRDYDPKMAPKAVAAPDNYFVSPITNERIALDKIHDHVRYNLSDPRYLEKKEQMLQAKMKEDAVFASGPQIQDSLKNLAERRTDIFGINDAEAAIGRRIGEEEQDQSKDNKITWDGHKSSLKRKKLQ